jgi:hypothetical protein
MAISVGAAMLGSAALTFLGGERANSARAAATDSANRTSIELANTGYTRAMKDMKSAGLNPILAGRYGPAATPNIQVPQIENTIGPAVSSAMQGARLSVDVDKIMADTGVSEAQATNIKELTNKVIQDTELSGQQTIGKAFENRVNSLISEFKEDNPNLTLFQAFGVDAGDLVDIIKSLTKKGK